MQLKSFAFNNNTAIPLRYMGNINPPLDIVGVPSSAKSLALIMHDPDAVSGDFIHWTIWDIRPNTSEILENSLPKGATEGITSMGKPGYIPPRPPRGSGRHHYTFELFALDIMLDLLPNTNAADLRTHMQGHVLDHAQIIGTVDA